jgi:hypothetical protein
VSVTRGPITTTDRIAAQLRREFVQQDARRAELEVLLQLVQCGMRHWIPTKRQRALAERIRKNLELQLKQLASAPGSEVKP